MIISVFTPHGGCPERCTFCDQRVSGGEPLSARHVTRTIEEHLASGGRAEEIAFYGGTFTAMPRERQLAYLEAAAPFLREGRIGAVRVSTRPDALEEAWLTRLRDEYMLRTVELGVQSFDPRVLAALGRSHSPDDVTDGVAALKRLGIRASLHMMIGCPREGADEDQRTFEWLERLRPDMARFHPLLVLKGTTLEREWRSGAFHPLTLERAIERAAGLVPRLEALGIQVIRLGLQPNDLLGEAVVAGPYHPSFGDLVRGRVLRDRLEAMIRREIALPEGRALEIRLPLGKAGTMRGKSGSNIEYLKVAFRLASVSIREEAGAELGVALKP